MRNHWTLLFGPVAVVILAACIVGLAQLVPGYNPVAHPRHEQRSFPVLASTGPS